MLTVCIPVFNDDVRKLVSDLLFQIEEAGNVSEIILIDDGSQDSCKDQYRELKNEKVTIRLLEKNIGRTRIRNHFLQLARYDNLLFLDADSQITGARFLKNYFECILRQNTVVCGGRIYPGKAGNKKYALHWKYGVCRESKTASERNRQPNRSFMTNNFMIQKEIFREIHFNDKLYGYGHEDTLLGFDLMQAGIKIGHIDNPVLHGTLVTNEEFLEKTVSGIKNLVIILNEVKPGREFIDNVSLLRTYFKCKKYGMHKVLYFVAPFFSWIIAGLLKKGFINLRLFDLYKLLVFCQVYRKQEPSL
jgi:glycosyltransferase involved in cell wall biosynthesis